MGVLFDKTSKPPTGGSEIDGSPSADGPASSAAVPGVEDQIRLVNLALAGNGEALGELAELVLPVIHVRVARYLFVHRRTHRSAGRADLEDIVQEVVIRLFANEARVLKAWNPKRGLDLHGFVGFVAQREIVNVLRSNRRRPWLEAVDDSIPLEQFKDDEGHTPEEAMARKDLARSVLARLHAWLTPRGRELFQLVYVEEQPIDEVARTYGMKPSAIYAWRNRVQKRARKVLREIELAANGPRVGSGKANK